MSRASISRRSASIPTGTAEATRRRTSDAEREARGAVRQEARSSSPSRPSLQHRISRSRSSRTASRAGLRGVRWAATSTAWNWPTRNFIRSGPGGRAGLIFIHPVRTPELGKRLAGMANSPTPSAFARHDRVALDSRGRSASFPGSISRGGGYLGPCPALDAIREPRTAAPLKKQPTTSICGSFITTRSRSRRKRCGISCRVGASQIMLGMTGHSRGTERRWTTSPRRASAPSAAILGCDTRHGCWASGVDPARHRFALPPAILRHPEN